MDIRIFTAALLFASTSASAAVYQCNVGGQKVFSDRPCATDAKEIEVKAAPKVGGEAALAQEADVLRQRLSPASRSSGADASMCSGFRAWQTPQRAGIGIGA